MSEYLNEFKKTELNRLLPSVKKTREKETAIVELEKKNRGIIEKWANIIHFKANIQNQINALLEEPSDEFKKIEASKIKLEKKINNLKKAYQAEITYYKAFLLTIINVKGEGVLEEADIQTEYLEEYIYLILLYYHKIKEKYIVNYFFKTKKDQEEFFKLVNEKYSNPDASVFKTLETGKSEGKLFFSLFGKEVE